MAPFNLLPVSPRFEPPLWCASVTSSLSESICCQKRRAFNTLIYHCQIQGFMACIWILYLRFFCDYRGFTYKLLYIRNIFFSAFLKKPHIHVFYILISSSALLSARELLSVCNGSQYEQQHLWLLLLQRRKLNVGIALLF